MKRLQKVLSIAFVMLLGAAPVGVFTEGAVTVESAEVIVKGVMVYHSSDGSETPVVKGASEAGTEEKEADRLTDRGEYPVGTGDKVSLIIEEEFQEGQPPVFPSGNGMAVPFLSGRTGTAEIGTEFPESIVVLLSGGELYSLRIISWKETEL